MGETYPVVWYDIAEPGSRASAGHDERAGRVPRRASTQGGASFGRLEGAWWGNDHIYFVSTSGGNAGRGQIWAYDPSSEHARS